MSDPYLVLGVKPSATDDEVKRAYRDLVKKYHPDNYQNNPLSELAEEKMKEVNEAYDAIVKMRSSGGYQTQQQYGGQSYGGGRQAGGDATLQQVRQLLDVGNLNEAQRLLEASSLRNAEWYFLMGGLAYRRGWLSEARENISMACNMDPGNLEYRQTMQYLSNQAGRGYQSYRGGGFSAGDLCSILCCYSMCCDCCN